MHLPRRASFTLLALVTAATTVATLVACSDASKKADTAAAGDAAAAAGPWQQPKTAWGDPDIQGMWPVVHLIQVPLQRPAQYGDRLTFNEDEIAKQRANLESRNTRYANENAQDRIGMGHWAEMSDLPQQTSLIVDPPNGQLPEQTELGKQQSATMGSSWSRQVFDSVADFDTWDRCITRGLPPSMFPFQYNNGIQVLQSPGYVVINMEMIHEARVIPVGNFPPLDGEVKQWLGSSRGHWEGNTLIVETTNFNGLASMTNFGTPGTPITPRATSTDLKIVERFQRTADNDLTYTVTVDDPTMQTKPWSAQLPWKRDEGYQFFEYACNEGNEAIRDFITTSRFKRAEEAAAAKKK